MFEINSFNLNTQNNTQINSNNYSNNHETVDTNTSSNNPTRAQNYKAFDYEQLKKVLQENGFKELYEILKSLQNNNIISDLKTELNSDGNYTLICKYEGNVYTFSSAVLNLEKVDKENSLELEKKGIYSEERLEELGFPSSYLINKYFDKTDNGYILKTGININNKTVLTIEELRNVLTLETFDEFIDNNYSTEKGSAKTDKRIFVGKYYIEKYLQTKYGGIERYDYDRPDNYMSDNTKAIVDKLYTDIATTRNVAKEDLSEADVVKYLLHQDKNFSKYLHEIYKEQQYFGRNYQYDSRALMSDVMGGISTIEEQIFKLNGNHYDNYGTPLDAMKTLIYERDPKLMNLPLMQSILSAANVTENDSIDTIYNKVENFLQSTNSDYIEDGYHTKPNSPCNNWKSLTIWLFENGYVQQSSYSEDDIAMYNLTPEEKEQLFYPATDANGEPILDENGAKKYYKFTGDNFYNNFKLIQANNEAVRNIFNADAALSSGCTVVRTGEELQKALNNGESVVLMNDIDLSSIENWIPVGTEDNPYNGKFIGNGFTIKNLNISSSNQFTGMFGVFSGQVTDLNIENATVTNTNSEYITSTGVFAGKVVTQANGYPASVTHVNIVNSKVNGNGYAGLLTGRVENDTKLNYKHTTIDNVNTSGTVNSSIAGGIVGYIDQTSSINNSSSKVNVNATKYAGGIVGACETTIINNIIGGHTISQSLFDGTLSGTDNAGSTLGCLLLNKETISEWKTRASYRNDIGVVLDGNENFTIKQISNDNDVFVPEHEHSKKETQDLAILKNYISTDNYNGTSSLDYVYNTNTGEKVYITSNNWYEIISNSQLYGLNEEEKQTLIKKAIDKLWNHSEEMEPNIDDFNNTTYLSWIKAIISAMGGKLIDSYTQCNAKKDVNINFIEFEVLGQKYHLPIKNPEDANGKNYRPVVLENETIKKLCEKYNINYDDMIKYGGFNVFRSINDNVTDFWIKQEDLINDYKYYFGNDSNVLDEDGNLSSPEIIVKVLEKALPRRIAAAEYKEKYGNFVIDYTTFKKLCQKYSFDTQYLKIVEYMLPDNKISINVYNLIVLAYGEEEAKKLDKSFDLDSIENLLVLVAQNSPIRETNNNSSNLVNKPEATVTYKIEDCLSDMQKAAKKLNLTESTTQGIYYSYDANGSYIYIWNPQTKKFVPFSINARQNGVINIEFSENGKAINRTPNNVYYEAILQAYILGFNFTNQYPWLCEKNGIYYEYDKEEGKFNKV